MIKDVKAEDWDAPPVYFAHDDTAPCPGCVHSHPSADIDNNPAPRKSCRVAIEEVKDEDETFSHSGCYFEPQGDAGWALCEGETAFERHRRYQEEEGEHAWAPFETCKCLNMALTQTDKYLKLPITQNCMKVLFHNNHSFLQRVNNLPHGPGWSCRKVTVQGNLEDDNRVPLQENVKLWSRDPVECVKELISNPLFKADMVYSPARAYVDHAGQHRVIDKMWTADWWGETQKALPKGATMAPIILLSDKTCLSQFRGDKSAWPVYILFHHCMALFLHPLIAAGQDGVEMVCADSQIVVSTRYWQHTYVTNFPEQCLVSCCKENHCPKCDGLNSVMHNPESTKDILERRKNGQHPPEFEENGLHAIYKPFWADMPHCNIFLAFTPDLLHQLHKGMFKDHLVKWGVDIVGEEEMDTHFKAMPDYPGLRHFKKGISAVKQCTESEHKEMQRVFIGLLTGAVPSSLQTALAVFHTNKDVLKELAIREHFNIPKLHQLTHYVDSITLLGAADGFNTELPKHLHIDFTKDAYRASNKWDYEGQMALWLQQQEAVFLCGAYLHWESQQPLFADSDSKFKDTDSPITTLSSQFATAEQVQVTHILAKVPAHPHQMVAKIVTAHGAIDFLTALQTFLHKNLPHTTIIPSLHNHFDVYHQVVIIAPPDQQVSDVPKRWHIRATPEVVASGRKPSCPARFDMALISDRPQSSRLRTLDVAQVCTIFSLPCQFGTYSRALTYIEWFMPFRPPDPSSQMRQVLRSMCQLCRNAAVIHVDKIVHPCHPIPKMGQSVDARLRSGNAYEAASDFYFKEFINGEMFGCLWSATVCYSAVTNWGGITSDSEKTQAVCWEVLQCPDEDKVKVQGTRSKYYQGFGLKDKSKRFYKNID
ncbi:hypothetical protein BDR07DRAFT_1449748 [Suillus spraguei]|nr:hypothetical protein BDR07DRAFT_1449748 [Suillus spraguei]